ncbi:branched-chain-amino-acid transaminase [Candidatus Macondimonas diazotrophica]|jgi:branched-chain amino acid aminotransferase|nr:branched-chain-amino-acid transaminase [Candidatus Macondimonas diazotrophica]HBG31930.1 branched-chain-amino-acid transaminase [Gammaproteobacteria bacterium]HBG51823.1 branched-chain-amino-acid transaminase [Gammaproteobacteria bacterium]
MSDQAICWLDGHLIPAAEASVSVFDHGLLYGDGVFEGIRFYHRRVFRLAAHLQRLADSARVLALELPLDTAGFGAAIAQTIAATPWESGYLRLVVTRGVGALGLDPRSCSQPCMFIIADRLKLMAEDSHRGARLIIAATRRLGADGLDPRIKSLNYLNPILARLEANHAGADEAIMLNTAGRVAEGTADNVFIVRERQLFTPPVTEGALDGVTRGILMELAAAAGIRAAERPLSPYDLYTADECFLTGTAAEVVPVAEIDGRPLRQCPGPVYTELSTRFQALIDEETRESS